MPESSSANDNLIIFSDFDGTISTQDIGNNL